MRRTEGRLWLEWAYVEAFDGASLSPLTESGALLVSPATVLALQPHLQLLHLRYPIDDLVIAVHRGMPDAEIVSNAATLRKLPVRERLPAMRRADIWLAVHRHDDSVHHSRLTAEQFRLLSALRDGYTVDSADSQRVRQQPLHAPGRGCHDIRPPW